MLIQIDDEDFAMLCKMVERGWAEGDLAEYLDGDQILSCERILGHLEITRSEKHPSKEQAKPL